MAITASSITADNTLDEFRVQFNNLVTDVDGISSLSAFGESITFDGATTGGSKTTVQVVDPTAANIIRFPNVGAASTNPGSVDSVATILTDMNADSPTTITSSGDVSHVLVNDDGVLKKITASNLGITGAPAANDITTGNAAVTIATSSGNITIDAQAGDADIIFKGTDGSSDITALTLDMSEEGLAVFTGNISLADNKEIILGTNNDISLQYDESTTDSLVISSQVNDAALGIIFQADDGADAGDEWKMNFANGGVFTFGNDINSAGTHVTLLTITPNSTAASSTHAFIGALSASSTITATGGVIVPDDGDVGSASATDAMQISSTGIVTFKDDILIKDGGTIGVASSTSAITIASTGIVTLVDDLLLKDACTIGTATTAGAVSIAADGTVNLATAGATVNSAVIKTAGKETIYVPASAMYPTTTAGCAELTQVEGTAGRAELKCLDFDPSSDENAQFTVAFPKSWNAGTITFRAFFTVTGTNTGTVSWELAGGCIADNGVIDTALGTAVAPTAKAHSGTSNDLNVTDESGNVTIANAADDTMTFFNIERKVASDNQTGDARLLGIQIFFTTSATNDA